MLSSLHNTPRSCHRFPSLQLLCRRRRLSSKPRFVVAEEVQDRLHRQQPVVAFESTVIAQGLPFPENLKLHERMVAIARKMGVTPATIGTRRTTFLLQPTFVHSEGCS